MSKYGNVKTQTLDGEVFDSKKESVRWCQLLLLQKAGIIKHLQRQVKYELIPKQKGEKACAYVADFVYTDCESGQTVVKDVKGHRTEVYKIKKKLMLYVHNIRIREV